MEFSPRYKDNDWEFDDRESEELNKYSGWISTEGDNGSGSGDGDRGWLSTSLDEKKIK